MMELPQPNNFEFGCFQAIYVISTFPAYFSNLDVGAPSSTTNTFIIVTRTS